MNHKKIVRRITLIVIVVLLMIILIIVRPFSRKSIPNNESDMFTEEGPFIEYLLDSTYKAVIDTVINIYKVETGERISTLPLLSGPIRSIAMSPAGDKFLILDEYNLYMYDLEKDNLANQDTSALVSEEITGIDCFDQDYIEFSSNGKYLMIIDYSNQTVDIYEWPGLKHLDTGVIGYYKNFWWKNKSERLYFYYVLYGYKKYIYQIEFPADLNAKIPVFSEPVCIDSLDIDLNE
jgi:hypothetical protein